MFSGKPMGKVSVFYDRELPLPTWTMMVCPFFTKSRLIGSFFKVSATDSKMLCLSTKSKVGPKLLDQPLYPSLKKSYKKKNV